MYGRNVTIPTNITKVLVCGPVEMQMVYMLAPDLLAGLTFTFNGNPTYVPEKYSNLPVVGGWYGKSTGNYETFMQYAPDIILTGDNTTIDERQEKFGTIPVVGVYCGNLLTNYKEEILFLGELFGVQEQAQKLLTFYEDAMSYVIDKTFNIQDDKAVTVYYAEGSDGLLTDPAGSMHTLLLSFCGGKNIANVTLLSGMGQSTVSMEQVLLWNPQMIIIGRSAQLTTYNYIMSNSTWQQIDAVKNNKVYIRPDNPCSWFDGPPGVGQILGMYWMVHTLYPSLTTDLDLNAKVTEFYSNFYHYDLTSEELALLMTNGGNL